MQSRGLFDFFTKAAGVQQTTAGTRIVRGPATKATQQQTSAVANKALGGGRGARSAAPRVNNSAQVARPNDSSRYDDMRYGPKQQPTQAKPQTPATPVATDAASTNARNGNVMMRGGAQANASNVTPTSPPSPITFTGGYTVGGVSGDVDWAAKGDGSINVGGAKLTADQYNAFNNVRSSLATQLRQQEGLSHEEARARATQMANQWMADQTAVANGGKAQNRWQHVENPQPSAQPTTQPTAQPAARQAAQPTTQPAAPQQQSNQQPTPQAAQPDGAAEQQPLVRDISNRDILQRWGDNKFTTNNYITSHRQNAYNNMLRLYNQYKQLSLAEGGGDMSELANLDAQLKEQAQLYAYLKNQGTLPQGDQTMNEANEAYWSMDNMKRRASRYDADDIAKWVNLPGYAFK